MSYLGHKSVFLSFFGLFFEINNTILHGTTASHVVILFHVIHHDVQEYWTSLTFA
jgi:hypothetical protein